MSIILPITFLRLRHNLTWLGADFRHLVTMHHVQTADPLKHDTANVFLRFMETVQFKRRCLTQRASIDSFTRGGTLTVWKRRRANTRANARAYEASAKDA